MMMARARQAAPEWLTTENIKTAGGGMAITAIVAMLFYGVRYVMPDMMNRLDRQAETARVEAEKRTKEFTEGLKAQGDRAVAIINEQSKQFSAELKQQRASDERRTKELTEAINSLRAAIERKGP